MNNMIFNAKTQRRKGAGKVIAFWTAVAERSGDTAFREPCQRSIAAWRFASRRSPKSLQRVTVRNVDPSVYP